MRTDEDDVPTETKMLTILIAIRDALWTIIVLLMVMIAVLIVTR